MKKIILTFAIAGSVLALSVTSLAQSAGPATGATTPTLGQAQVGKHRGALDAFIKILDQLNLTADQKTSIKDLGKKTLDALKEAREANKATPDPVTFKAKRQQLMKDYRSGLFSILTPEQVAQFKVLWKEAHQKSQNVTPPAPPKP